MFGVALITASAAYADSLETNDLEVSLTSLVLALELLELAGNEAVTVSFLTLAFAQLWHVFNMRVTRRAGGIKIRIFCFNFRSLDLKIYPKI